MECAEWPPLSLRQKDNEDQLREIAVDQLRRLRMIFEGGSQHAAAAGGDGSRTHCVRKTAAPCSLVPRSVSCEEVCRSLRSAAVHRGYFVRSWCSGSSSVIAFVFELGRAASQKAPLQTTSGAHDEWFQTRLQKRCSRRVVCAFGRGSGGVREDLGGGPGGLGAPFGRLRGRLGPLLAALEPVFAVLALCWPLLGRSWSLLGRSWAALGPLLGSSWGALDRF